MPAWLWWSFYSLGAIWAQYFWAGLDFFTPGLLICLQDRRIKTALILSGVWLFLVEGTGSLAFGSQLIYLVGVFVFFGAGALRLEPENPVFVVIFSLTLALWHTAVSWSMLSLQDLQFDGGKLLAVVPGQWMATVFVWGAFLSSRFLVRIRT